MARHIANKDFGQHFLVDENILRVIERLADLAPDWPASGRILPHPPAG